MPWPLLVYRARESEDLTWDKSDPKDAVLIARLAGELRCYEPERADAACIRRRARAILSAQSAGSVSRVGRCCWSHC